MKVEQVTGPIAYHAEGPVWSERWGGLRWVDMLAGDILSLADDGSVQRRHVAEVVAAIRPRVAGGSVLGVERGFALEDPDGTVSILDPLWHDPGVRMNEGACDPDGRFYCGSVEQDQTPGAAALYRLDPDGSTHKVFDGVTVSNGLAWSPDGTRAFYNDTATHEVAVFDYDPDQGLTGRRTFARVPNDGWPDGLTIDANGGVWVAIANGGVVQRYDTAGVLDEVVEVPAVKVTACTFGGAGLDQLFITTSQENIDTSEDPQSGSLFVADVGVRGLPVREFRG